MLYIKLNKYIDEKGYYRFQQNNNVVAKVDARKPYLNPKNKILNQKWHVLIALLAFYDITSFEEECKECDVMRKWNVGKIREIQIKKSEKEITLIETKIFGKKEDNRRFHRCCPSKLMNKWILAAIENQYLK